MAQNFFNLFKAINDVGAKVARRYLQHRSGYASLPDLLNNEKHKLYHSWFPRDNGNCCCRSGVRVIRSNITKVQFEMLFFTELPSPCQRGGKHHCWYRAIPTIDFDILDITLTCAIISVIMALSKADNDALDNIRNLRNVLAHSPEPSINDLDFRKKWSETEQNLLDLAKTVSHSFSTEIKNVLDHLRTENLSDKECERLLSVMKYSRETDRLLEGISDRLEAVEHNQLQSKETRLKQRINNTEMMLAKHKKGVYVPGSKAEKQAYERLRENHHITISGRGGQGKSSLGRHLMYKVCNEYVGDQQEYTPVILDRADDFCLIDGKGNFVILIDDPFGKTNIDKGRLEEWEHHFFEMLSLIQEGNIFIIMCIRSSILKDSSDTLVKYDLFKDENKVDLSSRSFSLTQEEKYAMLEAYCENHKVSICEQDQNVPSPGREGSTGDTKINRFTLVDISKSDPFGFPQSCQLFFSNKNLFNKGLEFFTQPDDSLIRDISNKKDSAPQQYIVFVYMLLEGGRIDLGALNEEKLQKVFECLQVEYPCVDDIKECVLYKISRAYIQNLDSSTESQSGSQQSVYEFTHETILEAVMLSFGKRYPDVFLELCNDEQIFEFARPERYKQKLDEVCIKVTKRCHRKLAERFVHKHSCFGIDMLLYRLDDERLLTDKSFVEDLFHVMDEDYINLSRRKSNFYGHHLNKKAGKVDTDIPDFIEALCERFTTYKQTSTKVYDTAERSLGKLKLPVDLFIEFLHYMLENGKTDAVNKLLDDSGLDLHSRYLPSEKKYNTEEDDSHDIMATCNVDELCADIDFSGMKGFFYHSFGNPVCYACILGHKNLVLRFLDIMDTVILDEVTERLVYLLIERDWLDVLQKLIDKNSVIFSHIGLSHLVFHAVQCGNKNTVLYFLNFDIDVTLTNTYGQTLLHYCCEYNWDDVFDMVVQKYKNVLSNTKLSQSEFILHAAKYSMKQMVSYLFKYDIDFTRTDEKGKTLLHYCCEYEWVDIFDKVLQKNQNVLNKSDLNSTVLVLYAAKHFKKQMVLHLLRHGVDDLTVEENNKTLLHHCCEKGWYDIFDIIIEKDEHILSKLELSISNLILIAADAERKEMVLHLLQYVDRDLDYETLFSYCCVYDWVEIFDKIVEKREDLLRNSGLSLSVMINLAASRKSEHMVSRLLRDDKYLDFTVKDKNGQTLLHHCCENGWDDIFHSVLQKDKELLGKSNLYPSDLILHAAKYERAQLVSYLLEYNIDLKMLDENGESLLHRCCQNGWVDILRIILEKYRDVTSSDLILYAAKCHKKRVTLVLLQYCSDFTQSDSSGKTLLHYCCEKDWIDVFDEILKINVNVLKEEGLSPSILIFIAARNDCKRMVAHLPQYGVDFAMCNEKSETILHLCCKKGWFFDKLLEKYDGLRSGQGPTPSNLLLYAVKYNNKQMALHLLKYGIDLNVLDENDKNVVTLCQEIGWDDVVNKILDG